MIDLLELKSETKHAVGFKNNFYKIRICYSKFLNNINYSLYDWKNKIDLINTNRFCTTLIELQIPKEGKKKAVEIIFENYGFLMSFVKKYNEVFTSGYTPFFIKVIYKKPTNEKYTRLLNYDI